jgi:hypothetical protein
MVKGDRLPAATEAAPSIVLVVDDDLVLWSVERGLQTGESP